MPATNLDAADTDTNTDTLARSRNHSRFSTPLWRDI